MLWKCRFSAGVCSRNSRATDIRSVREHYTHCCMVWSKKGYLRSWEERAPDAGFSVLRRRVNWHYCKRRGRYGNCLRKLSRATRVRGASAVKTRFCPSAGGRKEIGPALRLAIRPVLDLDPSSSGRLIAASRHFRHDSFQVAAADRLEQIRATTLCAGAICRSVCRIAIRGRLAPPIK
jgi:hypothetical protein